MFRLLATITLLFISISKGFCYNICIEYKIIKDSTYTKHKVSDYCLDIVNNNWDSFDLNSGINIPCVKNVLLDRPGYEIVIINYEVTRSGIYIITDIYGHEVFLDKSMQGDTIRLTLNQTTLLPEIGAKSFLNDSVSCPWFFKITYPDKYKYMGFIDSVTYLNGDLRVPNYSFKGCDHSLTKYFSIVNRAFANRKKFLNWFSSEYYMPPAIKYLAEKEIQYCYYSDLYQPIIENDSHLINDYPQSVTDTLKNVLNNLNDQELFNNTIFYKRVIIAHVSTYDILGGSLMEGLDSNYLNNRLNYCRTKLKNQMQGYALAWFMSRLIHSNQNSFFDLFYKNYNYNTSSSGTNKYVDSLKSLVSHSKMKPEEFLNFKFEDKSHVSNKLRDYINKDFVLIDFWATWCIPCREQVPYLESLAKKYKDKIQFISISADQFISKWDKWIKDSTGKHNNILQIHALNGFENQLLKRLMISSIPRYLFISKEGKIIEEDAPRPNDPKLAELFNLSLKD